MSDLRIGSLCSGYAGLDMAVMDVLGGSVAWHCQYEPPDKDGKPDRWQYAARILEHHWPDVPNLGDLTKVDWTKVEPVDVVTFGFPCTDLSYAGRGAGIKEGTRSGLWFAGVDAIRALRPRLVVLENVRAIVNRRPGLDVVLASLAELRLDAEWLCLPASDVGAPHERYRWFCLARPADPEGSRLEGPRLRGRAASSSGAAADPADLGHEWRGRTRRWGARPEDRGHVAAHARGDGRERSQECDGTAPQPGLEAPCGDDVERRLLGWGKYAAAVHRWERTLGRPAPSPVDDRGRLSPHFVEWMMGLPKGHVCDVPAPEGMSAAGLRNARLKALGNGVVPPQAAYALRMLLDRARQEAAA